MDEQKIIGGFEKIAWKDVEAEQSVFVAGEHDGKPCAFGPYKIRDKSKYLLLYSSGKEFEHPEEDLITRS